MTQQATQQTHDAGLKQLSLDVRAAVRSEASLLISGERGVTRLVARLVHERSLWGAAGSRFVGCRHADLLDGLASFAAQPFPSLSQTREAQQDAERWTLYIEDVDQLTLAAQESLLYFLDVVNALDSFRRAGRTSRTVRVIAATTSDLSDRAARETLRLDLFYRLNVIYLVLPQIRGNHEDLASMVDYLLGETAREIDAESVQLTAHLLRERLLSDWSANSSDLRSLLTSLGASINKQA